MTLINLHFEQQESKLILVSYLTSSTVLLQISGLHNGNIGATSASGYVYHAPKSYRHVTLVCGYVAP